MKHKRIYSNTLIVLPFGLPFLWSADYELQTAIALTSRGATVIAYLANEGRTLFHLLSTPSPIFEIKYGVIMYRPLYILPFHRFRAIRIANYWIATKWLIFIISLTPQWKKLKKIFWTFSLQRSVYPLWFNKTVFKIYDCVDMFMPGRRRDIPEWLREERRILEASDVIFTNSPVLYEQKRKKYPHVFLLPEGMFIPALFPARTHTSEPVALASIPHPRVLFVGNINTRLDFATIRRVATRLPHYSFIFVGNTDVLFSGPDGVSLKNEIDSWNKQKNIYPLPAVPRNKIASYIRSSDIGFIPYDIRQQFNKYCYPIKIQEFFSQGKPVVASAIETLKSLSPLSLIYRTPDEAVYTLKKTLSRPWPKVYQAKQRRIALSNSVDNKLAKAETILLKYFSRVF